MKNIILCSFVFIMACNSSIEVNDDHGKGSKQFKDGWEELNVSDSMRLKTFYESNQMVKQYLINIKNGDTIYYNVNNVSRRYWTNLRVRQLSDLNGTNGDTSRIKTIKINANGIIEYYKGPLNFLTKRDSMRLDKSYPDWKAQVRKWEIKETNP